MDPNRFDIFDIYRRYCDILSGNIYACGSEDYIEDGESQGVKLSRESLAKFLKLVESRVCSRHSIIDELHQLMLRLDLMGDFSEFSRFYGFVFFMCRENGQKNITVTKAINAWKLILSGRFRLLNQWCDFLQKNQRHNISEDTWRQVLAFSRCVHENFEGYDPEGAWPVVIDDFVEYMYRMTGNSDNPNLSCNCGDSQAQTCQNKVPLPGIVEGTKTHNDLKRKFIEGEGHGLKSPELNSCSSVISPISKLKRMKQFFAVSNTISFEKSPSSPLSSTQSPCAVEGGLSSGFAGLFSTRPPLQFDQKST